MKKMKVISMILMLCLCTAGCQASNIDDSQASATDESTAMPETESTTETETVEETTTETITEPASDIDYDTIYDKYLCETLAPQYGVAALDIVRNYSENFVTHNELLGLVSALVYDFGDDSMPELLVLTRETSDEPYLCNCYLTLYVYEDGAVNSKDKILLDEYVIAAGGEHGDQFQLSIYGDTIYQHLATCRYASSGPDAVCNEYTVVDVLDNQFSKLVFKANITQVENRDSGEVLYHNEAFCRDTEVGGCNSYPDKNDIEKANTTIRDMLAQKHFMHFDGINLNDGNGILLDITGEPDAKICDYDSIYYSKFLTTDYTRLRERDSLKSYISPDTTVPEATEPNTYAVEITSCSRTGEIKGADVAGFTTSYVCQNGSVSYVRRTLGDRWHVTAVRTCESKGLTWYELYDTDDGEYYGWVDANYITFYDDVPATTAPVTEPTVSNWKAAYRIALDNFKNSARYQSDSMWDLADVDGDGTPELFISEGWAIACGVYLYYYDGKQAVLLDSDGNGNGDLLGSMGSIAICKEESLIESWYYNHGIQSDVIYRYANHTISKVGNFYNDEDASDDPGTYEVNGESVTSDVFEAALQEHNAKNWIGIGQKYEFNDYSALG